MTGAMPGSGSASNLTAPSTPKYRPAKLRLYIAHLTPNSLRAERNLRSALEELGDEAEGLELEIVDVLVQAKRAITDGVIVTPTLIGLLGAARSVMLGDLTDRSKLMSLLQSLAAR